MEPQAAGKSEQPTFSIERELPEFFRIYESLFEFFFILF